MVINLGQRLTPVYKYFLQMWVRHAWSFQWCTLYNIKMLKKMGYVNSGMSLTIKKIRGNLKGLVESFDFLELQML